MRARNGRWPKVVYNDLVLSQRINEGSTPQYSMPHDRIEWSHIQHVLSKCPVLDEYRAYYRQFDVPHRRVGPLVPRTRDLLRAALRPDMRVLDIGCGRGETLLECASLFRWGDGIDESADVMIEQAAAEQRRRGVRNVQFHAAKAAALPFASEVFDLAFSERGPMGQNDVTLREALRVLRPGGLLFIEMIGAWNSWETRMAFETGYVRPLSPTALLEAESQRLERHGVRIQTLASRLETLEFDSLDDWLTYQIYSWSPPGRDAFSENSMSAIDRFRKLASSPDGTIRITLHTYWLAGAKVRSAT